MNFNKKEPFRVRVTRLNANSIIKQGLSCTDAVIENGGYTQRGNLVIVNTRINITKTISQGHEIVISGYPCPRLNGGTNIVPVYTSITTESKYMNYDGSIHMYMPSQLAPGIIVMIGCCYII